MKSILLIGGLLVALLNGLALIPALAEIALALNALGVLVGIGFAFGIATKWPQEIPAAPVSETGEKPAPSESIAPPPKVDSTGEPDHAELLQFLAQLQEKGRFVDFVMDDVSTYTDAQIGAAARVVHGGCQAVVKGALAVKPVTDQPENSAITLEPGYSVSRYRLIGKVVGEPPFTGQLVHKGWEVTEFKLPKLALDKDAPLPPVAAAQVELK